MQNTLGDGTANLIMDKTVTDRRLRATSSRIYGPRSMVYSPLSTASRSERLPTPGRGPPVARDRSPISSANPQNGESGSPCFLRP